jgi:Replication initiator protein A
MEEGPKTTKEDRLEGEPGTALEVPVGTLPSTEFVKVEKNLASLGFFTPSSKRLRNAQEKSFTMTTVADGQRMELKGTIIPSAKYGLPITADQDKWIALCKILTDIIRKEGRVTNPVAFTSAEILRLLHKHRHSGKNYREVEEWLDAVFNNYVFRRRRVSRRREASHQGSVPSVRACGEFRQVTLGRQDRRQNLRLVFGLADSKYQQQPFTSNRPRSISRVKQSHCKGACSVVTDLALCDASRGRVRKTV